MAKAEGEKIAHVIPLGSVRSEGVRRLVVLVAGTDHETNSEALREFAMETGATLWESQEIDREGNPKGGKSFYFSGDKWKAPWQPKGPPPNWQTADPNEPIN